MSAILKQLESFKQIAAISTEFNDMVSIERLSELTGKDILTTKRILKKGGIHHIGKLGKSYLFSKSQVLQFIKNQ